MPSEQAELIASLSAREIADALKAPSLVRAVVEWLATPPSLRLGRRLARFDEEIARIGVGRAAREVLATFGASVVTNGRPPAGGALVVVNHPGAYDALALLAAIARPDVMVVASDRAFLRALSRFAEHCLFVPESPMGRARVVRRAERELATGKVIVQFGAGAIEPDASFEEPRLGEWNAGTGSLVAAALRANACVVPAFIQGVHSPRAKRLFFVRWAERRNVTTIASLVQATIPGFRDVTVGVRFGTAIAFDGAAMTDAERTERARSAVLALGALPRMP